jgi:hypothetical protein
MRITSLPAGAALKIAPRLGYPSKPNLIESNTYQTTWRVGCKTGASCEQNSSTCGGRTELCIARGPAYEADDFGYASNLIIATRQSEKAKELWASDSALPLKGRETAHVMSCLCRGQHDHNGIFHFRPGWLATPLSFCTDLLHTARINVVLPVRLLI